MENTRETQIAALETSCQTFLMSMKLTFIIKLLQETVEFFINDVHVQAYSFHVRNF